MRIGSSNQKELCSINLIKVQITKKVEMWAIIQFNSVEYRQQEKEKEKKTGQKLQPLSAVKQYTR